MPEDQTNKDDITSEGLPDTRIFTVIDRSGSILSAQDYNKIVDAAAELLKQTRSGSRKNRSAARRKLDWLTKEVTELAASQARSEAAASSQEGSSEPSYEKGVAETPVAEDDESLAVMSGALPPPSAPFSKTSTEGGTRPKDFADNGSVRSSSAANAAMSSTPGEADLAESHSTSQPTKGSLQSRLAGKIRGKFGESSHSKP